MGFEFLRNEMIDLGFGIRDSEFPPRYVNVWVDLFVNLFLWGFLKCGIDLIFTKGVRIFSILIEGVELGS